jgi:hypothetical protein
MQGLSAEVARMLPPTKRIDGVEAGIELAVETGADAAT